MATGMPELGSKISLISKADIRYEGRLFTVDPQECTIALASVRSFGTEDREAQYPVPAQNQVYDYILFRGSDIKDIRVVNNVAHPQPLNDPAIMQLSVPPSLGGQTFQGHPVLGPMGPQLGQFAGAYGGMGAMGGLGSAGLGSTLGMQRDSARGLNTKPSELIMGGPAPGGPSVLSPTVEPPRTVNDHDLIGGASRSTTPASLGSRKSPTNDQGCQTGSQGGRRDEKKQGPGVRPIQPPGSGIGGGPRGQQRRRSRERRDSRGDGVQGQNRTTGGGRPQGNNQSHTSAGSQGYHQGGFQGSYQQGGNQSNRVSNWVNRGPMRPRGRPRGGGFRGNNQAGNQQGGGNNKTKNTLKFENDYDFEQANTEFEELRSQFGKVKLDEAGSTTSTTKSGATMNGDVDKKDDSGNETGAGETEQEEEHEVYYDKTKSFFDKISCEAVERAKGKSQRTDWRVERKLNSETFGVAAARRGGYRGRGGYKGMMYRGGYRSSYNRQPQRRDQQQTNQNQQSQPASQQQQQGNRSDMQSQKQQQGSQSATNCSASQSIEVGGKTPNTVNKKTIPEPVMAVK